MSVTAFNRYRREAAKEVVHDGNSEDNSSTGAGASGDGANGAGDGGNAAGANTGAGLAANTGGSGTGEGEKSDSAAGARLTDEQLDEMMRNKQNVMAALSSYNVEYSDRESADALRERLRLFLTVGDLLPVGGVVDGSN